MLLTVQQSRGGGAWGPATPERRASVLLPSLWSRWPEQAWPLFALVENHPDHHRGGGPMRKAGAAGDRPITHHTHTHARTALRYSLNVCCGSSLCIVLVKLTDCCMRTLSLCSNHDDYCPLTVQKSFVPPSKGGEGGGRGFFPQLFLGYLLF